MDIPEGATVEQVNGGEGIIVRAANGRFLPGTRSHAPISHENAREFQQTRWQRHRERVQQAAIDAAIETGHAPQGALAVDFAYPIAKAQSKLALSGKRESTRAAEFVFTHAGYPSGGDQQAASGVRLEVWGDALDRVLAVLAGRRNAQLEEQATDVQPSELGSWADDDD